MSARIKPVAEVAGEAKVSDDAMDQVIAIAKAIDTRTMFLLFMFDGFFVFDETGWRIQLPERKSENMFPKR